MLIKSEIQNFNFSFSSLVVKYFKELLQNNFLESKKLQITGQI